jgi:hypothetical protein
MNTMDDTTTAIRECIKEQLNGLTEQHLRRLESAARNIVVAAIKVVERKQGLPFSEIILRQIDRNPMLAFDLPREMTGQVHISDVLPPARHHQK